MQFGRCQELARESAPRKKKPNQKSSTVRNRESNFLFLTPFFCLFENLNKIGLTRQQYNYEWRLPRDNVLEWPAAAG